MSLSETDFRRACGCFATGIAVLTVATPDGEPHGLTINSFASLSLDPPLVLAAIAHTSTQLPAFDAGGHFVINILRDDQREISSRFARQGQHRFREEEWEEGIDACPLLKGAIAAIECRVVERFDAGDHRVLIGEAVNVHTNEGQPLLYFRSGYRHLGT